MSKNAENRIKELERQLIQITQERDELQRDVESLCMQSGGGNMWNRSYVLSERFSSLEQELSSSKQEITRLTAERDALKEDLHQSRTSRKTQDNSLNELVDRNRCLEREIAFYQEQTARAVSDRDKYAYEAEELRNYNLKLEKQFREAQARADTEQSLKENYHNEVATLQKLNKDLEFKAAEGEKVPELTLTLNRHARRIEQLEEELKLTQDKLSESAAALIRVNADALEARTARTALQQMLEEKQKAAATRIARLEDQNRQLQAEVDSRDFTIQNLKSEAVTSSEAISALQADMRKAVATANQQLTEVRESHQAELEALKAELSSVEKQRDELKSEKQDLTKAKLDALVRLEEQQVKYSEAMGKEANLKQKVRDLREKLTTNGSDPTLSSATGAAEAPAPASGLPARTVSSAGLLDHDDVDVPALQEQLAALQEKMTNVERLTSQSRPMREKLMAAARKLWNNARDEKVIGEINRVGDECSSLRSKIGVPRPDSSKDGKKDSVPTSRRADKLVAIEVLELLDFCMDSLKQYNQSVALTSLLDAF